MILSELLGHCLIMIRETAMKRGLTVDLKVSEQLYEGKIQADDVRLKQIVMNLLSNAAKFTPIRGDNSTGSRNARERDSG